MTTQQLYISWKAAVRAKDFKKAIPLAAEIDKRPDRDSILSWAKPILTTGGKY